MVIDCVYARMLLYPYPQGLGRGTYGTNSLIMVTLSDFQSIRASLIVVSYILNCIDSAAAGDRRASDDLDRRHKISPVATAPRQYYAWPHSGGGKLRTACRST